MNGTPEPVAELGPQDAASRYTLGILYARKTFGDALIWPPVSRPAVIRGLVSVRDHDDDIVESVHVSWYNGTLHAYPSPSTTPAPQFSPLVWRALEAVACVSNAGGVVVDGINYTLVLSPA